MSMSFKASPDGTYGEILVNGAVVAKLPVTGNAVLPGLVGTVSESGGIPTGAVVERGSNANGEYVRFADGTQICTMVKSVGAPNVAAGSLFWTTASSFTTPATFVNSNFSGGCTCDAPSAWGTVQNTSASSVDVALYNPTSSPNARSVRVVLVGRWY